MEKPIVELMGMGLIVLPLFTFLHAEKPADSPFSLSDTGSTV